MGETWKRELSEKEIETGVVDKNRIGVRSNMKLKADVENEEDGKSDDEI